MRRGDASRTRARKTQFNARKTNQALTREERRAILQREAAITRAVNELPIPATNFELIQALRLIGDNIWRMQTARLYEWRRAYLSRETNATTRATFYRAIHPDYQRYVRAEIHSYAALKAREEKEKT